MAIATAVTHAKPRPFLKWAGGKSRLLAQYQAYFPSHFVSYYEPFLGGGAVFFHLLPRLRSAMLADINPELVNVYQCVRDYPEAVIAFLQGHRDRHSRAYYYALRSQRHLSCPIERAARLLYLNKTCYNGLYRENSKGHFNVPMGRYKNPAICDMELLTAASQSLQVADIYQAPFDQILRWATGESDFVYLDPPYHPISTTSNFTGYNRYGFTATDQRRLQEVFVTLAQRGVKVMLSNSNCGFIQELYQGYPQHLIQASRAINSNAQRRGRISELLITSYPVALPEQH